MANLFEFALSQNETDSFFRGEGIYFVPSPDYEGHVHGAHMGGHARNYADTSESCTRKFDHAFLDFLKNLEVCRQDLDHLLANLSAYFSQKSRGGFYRSDIFSDRSSPGVIALNNYIAKIYKSHFLRDVHEQISRHSRFIIKKGSAALEEAIENVDA